MHKNDQKIILASGSPRRKELLEKMGFQFEVIKPDYEELLPIGMNIRNIPIFHSQKKAAEVSNKFKDSLVIASDTVVIVDSELLEKPFDLKHAKEMLAKLSGKTHEVITALTVQVGDVSFSISDIVRVTMGELSEDEIHYYVNKNDVLDKAGAYGAQDWIGLHKITKLEGSYFSVMGLPTHLLSDLIKSHFPKFLNYKMDDE